MNSVKVIIVYNNEGQCCTKVWRFYPDILDTYKLENMRKELIEFFPSIVRRRLGISLSYKDSLAGSITLETDSDLQVSRSCS